MKKLLTVLLCLFLALGVFISCSGKEEAAPAAEKVVETPKAETPAPKAEEPKVEETKVEAVAAPVAEDKAVFRLINGGEPASLDPHLIEGVPEHRIYESLFEGLFAYDPVTADAVPGLATDYEVSNEGKTYTFTLRDASWSDGVPITAQTVVDSWLRELDPLTAGPYAWFPSMFLEGAAAFNAGEAGPEAVQIRALDDHTFQMDLIGPLPYVLGALPHYSFAVVPMHAIEKYGDAWTTPENFVGNGPFTLNEWKPQEYISVVPNETYWDAEAVQLDEVIYYAIEDNNTAYNKYLNGEVDWMTTVPTDQIKAAKMRDDYYASPQLATYYYVFNVERAPFDDPYVRKALSLAIDRQALVDMVTQAGQIPAWGIVPPMSGYPGLESPFPSIEDVVTEADFEAYEDAFAANIELAKEYLEMAGYGEGGLEFPVPTLLYNTSEGHKKIAEFLQSQWKENLGIDITLENQEWKTYLASRTEHNFDFARAGWVGDYQDPNTFLDMFITGAGMNGGQYANPEYDRLINKAARMTPGAERFETLMNAENYIINEDQAILPLYYYVTLNMIDLNKWGGWHTNVMDYHPPKDIYLK